jgi:hypothetical protein
MDWARMLAYVTGTVDQELLARNEYLTAENRIVKAQLNGRLKLSDGERSTLGEIGHRLGPEVAMKNEAKQRLRTLRETGSTASSPTPNSGRAGIRFRELAPTES